MHRLVNSRRDGEVGPGSNCDGKRGIQHIASQSISFEFALAPSLARDIKSITVTVPSIDNYI
jgi:hypothetical protein